MSKKNKNPYREGSAYYKVCQDLIEASRGGALAKGITRQELIEKGHSPHDITVVLSPRAKSERGDCRGSISARGEIYFVHLPPRKVIEIEDENFDVVESKFDPTDPQRFIFRLRKVELPKLTRKSELKISDPETYLNELNVEAETSEVAETSEELAEA